MAIPRDIPKRLLQATAPAVATQYGDNSAAVAFVRDLADAKLDLHGQDARNALLTLQKRARKVVAEKL
jgi:hypothetical protein